MAEKGATILAHVADMKLGTIGGPIVTSLSAHITGIRSALKGDGPNAVKAGAGLWGGLSGGVIGFIVGGPIGAVVGGIAGGVAAGEGAKGLVNALSPPKDPPKKLDSGLGEKLSRFHGNYRREPPITGETNQASFVIDTVDGHNLMYWKYEDNRYPVILGLDFDKSGIVYVSHNVGGNACVSEFTMLANGDMEEKNSQTSQCCLWKRE